MHYASSTLIGGKGGAGPSSLLHTTLEGPTEDGCITKLRNITKLIDSRNHMRNEDVLYKSLELVNSGRDTLGHLKTLKKQE